MSIPYEDGLWQAGYDLCFNITIQDKPSERKNMSEIKPECSTTQALRGLS